MFSLYSFSQLFSGDIAFIGYNTDGGAGTNDNFTFIALTDIPGNEIIYFTEEGWDNLTGDWVGTSEGHITYTAPATGLSCGTVVHLNETGTSTFTVSGGGTAVLGSGSGWSLSGGDQVLAYSAGSPEPAITPTFITGVHGDDGNGSPISLDPVTGWNDSDLLSPLGTARSEVPPGLTNGIDCVSLFPTIGTEQDNAKYTGSLSGTSTTIRAAINDRTNWSFDNSTPFGIDPGDFSVSITCISLPVALYQFNASIIEGRYVKLVWMTASESNNNYFTIERSLNGIEWEKVNTIKGAGNSNSIKSYSMEDKSPHSGSSYYRLKQTDFDGQFEYSDVISIHLNNTKVQFGELYPNPSIYGFVHIDYFIEDFRKIRVHVFNMAGQLETIQHKHLHNGNNKLSFDLSDLNPGIYTLIVEVEHSLIHKKLVIER